jgi:cytochrome c-type biogenesis protein CcmH
MSGGLPLKAGGAWLNLALAAVALSASLLVSLFALAPHLHSAGLDTLRNESETRPPPAQAIDSAADADNYVRRLRAHLDQTPRDARGWVIFARLRAETDDFAEASQAYERALALPSKVANDAAVWCEFADALGMMQGGRLGGRPRELIDRALALNPNHPKALEMAGSAEYGQGDYASALRYWRPLLAKLEPQSQAHAELAAAIARTERLAASGVAAQGQ